jgi:hypothetical protein
MAKMSDIQRQLEQAAGSRRKVVPIAEARPTPVAAPEPVASAPEPPKAKPKPAKLSPRAGKKHIGAHLNPAFTSNLLIAKARTGKKMETLIADALNELFRSLNLPVVDDE